MPVPISLFFASQANDTNILSKFRYICPNTSPPEALRGGSGGLQGALQGPLRGVHLASGSWCATRATTFSLWFAARTTRWSTNYNPGTHPSLQVHTHPGTDYLRGGIYSSNLSTGSISGAYAASGRSTLLCGYCRYSEYFRVRYFGFYP